MVLSQAAADDHAAEISEREEANCSRSQRGDTKVVATGSDDGRTVLARVDAQSHDDHAPTDGQQGQAL